MNSKYSLLPPLRAHIPVSLLVLIFILLASCTPVVPMEDTKGGVTILPTLTVLTSPGDETSSAPSFSVTPRGPDLVATDPSTVSLASGGFQLIEFFRFT